MAYRPALTVRVEALGAVFYFGAADEAMARIAGLAMGGFDDGDVPPELIQPLCELAVEGIRTWEGVEGEDGQPVECTARARQDLPTMDKVQIAAAYLIAMQALDQKRGPAERPPIASSPPAASSGAEASDR